MKTTLKVLSVVAKIVIVIFAVIGVVMSIATAIIGTIYDHHLHDVVVNKASHDILDDEGDVINKAISLTMADPRLRKNKVISAVSYGAAKIVSFVAHL